MAKLNREQFLEAIKAIIGDDTSDLAMQFVEDMTDTFDGFATNENAQRISDLEQQLADAKSERDTVENDWRQRYRDRFFAGIEEDKLPAEVKDPKPVEPDRATTIQVNDLFTEE